MYELQLLFLRVIYLLVVTCLSFLIASGCAKPCERKDETYIDT